MTDEKDEDRGLPLHDEARAREKWRGGETILPGAGDRTGMPASEVDDARTGGGDSRVGDDGRPGTGRAGDFPPPD